MPLTSFAQPRWKADRMPVLERPLLSSHLHQFMVEDETDFLDLVPRLTVYRDSFASFPLTTGELEKLPNHVGASRSFVRALAAYKKFLENPRKCSTNVRSHYKFQPQKAPSRSSTVFRYILEDFSGSLHSFRVKHGERFARLNELVKLYQSAGKPNWVPLTVAEVEEAALSYAKSLLGGLVEQRNRTRVTITLSLDSLADCERASGVIERNPGGIPPSGSHSGLSEAEARTRAVEAREFVQAVIAFKKLHEGRLQPPKKP